jgi:hypothetical protein
MDRRQSVKGEGGSDPACPTCPHPSSIRSQLPPMDFFTSKILEHLALVGYARTSRERKLCFARDLSLVVLGVR